VLPKRTQFRLVKIGQIADFSQDVGSGDDIAKISNQPLQKLEVLDGVDLCSLEGWDAIVIRATNKLKNQEVRVNQHALCAVLLDQTDGIEHQVPANSLIFMARTSPVSLWTVKVLNSRGARPARTSVIAV